MIKEQKALRELIWNKVLEMTQAVKDNHNEEPYRDVAIDMRNIINIFVTNDNIEDLKDEIISILLRETYNYYRIHDKDIINDSTDIRCVFTTDNCCVVTFLFMRKTEPIFIN